MEQAVLSKPALYDEYLLQKFSRSKSLWQYQIEALLRIREDLLRYYHQWREVDTYNELKQNRATWYRNRQADVPSTVETFAHATTKAQRNLKQLYLSYNMLEPDGNLPFHQICNRACFWMATGSGKTLVIVKLIELLAELMSNGEIPNNDILILSHRDHLLDQILEHVDEYNASLPKRRIVLEDLKRFPDIKRQQSLLREQEITVFIYNSDNLTLEQSQKQLDFRNYENGGRWYIILDEAHRGDSGDSIRKAIFNIMSRNGFLFNFSATFTDELDKITTVYNFNLSEFIDKGYGKHISVLQADTNVYKQARSSKKEAIEDYSSEDKQVIALKALFLLTYIKRARKNLQQFLPYHSPMLVVFVNSVQVDDSDLEIFVKELVKVGRNEVDDQVVQRAKAELVDHLMKAQREFEGGSALSHFHESDILQLQLQDVLKEVFNADTPGNIEVILSQDKKELALKLKSGDQPYALIRIADAYSWLKSKLTENDNGKKVDISESVMDDTFFQSLNKDESSINILLGSRVFYEGWDSNRPNIAMYINIGTDEAAKKFVLQSLGRGVRISPISGKRGRFSRLYNEGDSDILEAASRCPSLPTLVEPVETLFVFSARRDALVRIVQAIDTVSPRRQWKALNVVKNEKADQHLLLIPVYKQSSRLLAEEDVIRKFPIARSDLELLKAYVQYVNDARILWARHDYQPQDIRLLDQFLNNPDDYFVINGVPKVGRVDVLLSRLKRHFSLQAYHLDALKPIDDEIKHYLSIQVSMDRFDEISEALEKVARYPGVARQLKESYGKLSKEDYDELAQSAQEEAVVGDVRMMYLADHYYYPVVVAQKDRVDYLKHIIQEPSEREFLHDLAEYLRDSESKSRSPFPCDWWMFSKLDEHLDRVYIPYYDRDSGTMREYHPDFIFWFQNGNEYTIVFVDPKGAAHADYQHKVDGYRFLFEEQGVPKVFRYNGLSVRVLLRLYTHDVNAISNEYRRYWLDKADRLLNSRP